MKCKPTLLLLYAFAVGLLANPLLKAFADDPYAQLIARCRQTRSSPQEQFDCCVAAIAAGLIKPGCSIQNIDRIFDTDYMKRPRMEDGPSHRGVVHFGIVRDNAPRWYLAFDFDSTGTIENYYLSNVDPWTKLIDKPYTVVGRYNSHGKYGPFVIPNDSDRPIYIIEPGPQTQTLDGEFVRASGKLSFSPYSWDGNIANPSSPPYYYFTTADVRLEKVPKSK